MTGLALRVGTVLAAAVACGGVTLAGAAAAPGGGGAGHAISRVSPASGYAENPVVAVDRNGDRTAAWTDYVARGDTVLFGVATATRRAGATGWGKAVTVAEPNDGSDTPELALAPSGAGVIVWTQAGVGRGHRLRSMLRATTRPSADAAWRAPVTISAHAASVLQFAVGIDAGGEITLAWTSADGGANARITFAGANALTGRWRSPQTLVGAARGGSDLRLAVNGDGEALIAWSRQVGETHPRHALPTIRSVQMTSYRATVGGWQRPLGVGRASEQEELPGGEIWAPTTPTIALDPAGGATVTWLTTGPGAAQILDVAHRPGGSTTWEQPVALTKQADLFGWDVGADAHGDLTVVWGDYRGRLRERVSDDGRGWSAPSVIEGKDAGLPYLVVGPGGGALLTWSTSRRVFVSDRAGPAAGWSRPVAVEEGSGYFPQAALDGAGHATVLWPQRAARGHFGQVIYATSFPAG